MSSVLVVDDHPMILLAVRSILERNGYEVVGEAENGVEALVKHRELEPDLVILDVRIPKLQGIEVIRRITASGLGTKVLVLSSMPAEILAKRCEMAGASAFVCKKSGLQDLLQGVKSTLSGYNELPAPSEFKFITDQQVEDFRKLGRLTDQEIMVMQYLAAGATAAEAAREMMLSAKTISTYKCRLFEKLGVRDMLQLQDFARRNSII
ncbi:response regulator [Pseudomonas sp. ZM23]|uniref:Response regulator n=1 Tax=Pseudomonas triclosanedens TaxID=2961893 RepID=A0ABY6ZQF7_9PSED|nr:response regulator [Pseudomonas triclosanedens]MCP8467520.1 response regulator [Pseudomonas triclosanedens]MCP8471697.1 response regulator [Pseudomonas triclosanedens]MCP8478950.1 response regulator [Pseudomonas triclosanedens]WAI47016.1 response regulator [Pseudomonas triclosanedens]